MVECTIILLVSLFLHIIIIDWILAELLIKLVRQPIVLSLSDRHILQVTNREMAQVKAALDALELSYTEFKRSRSLVQKSLAASVQNERTLTSKMNLLSAALTQLNSSHTTWVSRSDLSEDELGTDHVKYNTSWLESIWSEVDDLQERVDEALERFHSTAPLDEQKLANLKNQLESMQLDSASRLDLLLTKTNKSTQVLNPTSIKAYEGLLAESQRQLSSDLPSLVQSLSMCDPENSQSYSSEHEQFKRACNAKILDIQLQLADQLSASPIPVVSPVHPSTTFKSIEMEKSKAPTFSGG